MPHQTLIRFGVPPSIATTICAAGRFGVPVSIGGSGGVALANLQEWGHPYVIYFLTSAAIQFFIMLLRAWFKERSDNMKMLTEQLERQDRRARRREAEDAILRHEQANLTTLLTFQNYCLLKGIPMDNPPPPLYDVAAEREALRHLEELDIHATSSAGRISVQH
jgi:hypothetical protein